MEGPPSPRTTLAMDPCRLSCGFLVCLHSTGVWCTSGVPSSVQEVFLVYSSTTSKGPVALQKVLVLHFPSLLNEAASEALKKALYMQHNESVRFRYSQHPSFVNALCVGLCLFQTAVQLFGVLYISLNHCERKWVINTGIVQASDPPPLPISTLYPECHRKARQSNI